MNQATFKDFERIQVESHPYLNIQVLEGGHPDADNQFKIDLAGVIDDAIQQSLITEQDKDIIEKTIEEQLRLKQFRHPQCIVWGYKLYQSPSFQFDEVEVPFSQIVKYQRMWNTILR